MSVEQTILSKPRKWFLSLDTWAVFAALLAALLVRLGAFRNIPW